MTEEVKEAGMEIGRSPSEREERRGGPEDLMGSNTALRAVVTASSTASTFIRRMERAFFLLLRRPY